jgi:hypothetical protein
MCCCCCMSECTAARRKPNDNRTSPTHPCFLSGIMPRSNCSLLCVQGLCRCSRAGQGGFLVTYDTMSGWLCYSSQTFQNHVNFFTVIIGVHHLPKTVGRFLVSQLAKCERIYTGSAVLINYHWYNWTASTQNYSTVFCATWYFVSSW